jgi:hypothetical protein
MTTDRAREIGAVLVRELDDGRELAVIPTIFNYRLTIGPAGEQTIEDFYCYDGYAWCLRACETWDGKGDPPGPWKRHLRTSRRRSYKENGELEREWLQP